MAKRKATPCIKCGRPTKGRVWKLCAHCDPGLLHSMYPELAGQDAAPAAPITAEPAVLCVDSSAAECAACPDEECRAQALPLVTEPAPAPETQTPNPETQNLLGFEAIAAAVDEPIPDFDPIGEAHVGLAFLRRMEAAEAVLGAKVGYLQWKQGRILLRFRDALGYGEWYPWLDQHFGSRNREQTARNYMHIAVNATEQQARTLPLSDLYRLVGILREDHGVHGVRVVEKFREKLFKLDLDKLCANGQKVIRDVATALPPEMAAAYVAGILDDVEDISKRYMHNVHAELKDNALEVFGSLPPPDEDVECHAPTPALSMSLDLGRSSANHERTFRVGLLCIPAANDPALLSIGGTWVPEGKLPEIIELLIAFQGEIETLRERERQEATEQQSAERGQTTPAGQSF
jgi:hypothetical protein